MESSSAIAAHDYKTVFKFVCKWKSGIDDEY